MDTLTKLRTEAIDLAGRIDKAIEGEQEFAARMELADGAEALRDFAGTLALRIEARS
jgi:hypothetical protein